MSVLVDLHMHTTFSDGIRSPEELIAFTKSRNVSIMSINDHDTVRGVMNMLSLKVEGITVLCGIEMSNTFNGCGGIHITGYFPRDTDFEAFQKQLDTEVNQRRIDRAKKMIDLFMADGFELSWEELLDLCQNCLPSRPRIAELLVKQGYANSVADAFDRYLNSRTKYYVPGNYLCPEETINMIHKYSGVAFLAHPWLLRSKEMVMNEVVRCGIDGMECFPPSHHLETGTDKYINFARQHGLMVTSGSDYHGTKDPEVLPGDNIFPDEEKEATLEFFRKHRIL